MRRKNSDTNSEHSPRAQTSVIVGVDPGKNGAIAVIDIDGKPEMLFKMPQSPDSILDVFKEIEATYIVRHVFLENLHGNPHIRGNKMFVLGRFYGWAEAGITAANLSLKKVTPQVWQGALDCRTGGDKDITKNKAQETFPKIKCTHAVSDALLIAEYGRQLVIGAF